jgi:hypothetical protein
MVLLVLMVLPVLPVLMGLLLLLLQRLGLLQQGWQWRLALKELLAPKPL